MSDHRYDPWKQTAQKRSANVRQGRWDDPAAMRVYKRNWERRHYTPKPDFDAADVVAILLELAGVDGSG